MESEMESAKLAAVLRALREVARPHYSPRISEAYYSVILSESDIKRLTAAADMLDRQSEDIAELEELCGRLADILKHTAVALRGPEPPHARYGFADLPGRAAAAIAMIDSIRRQ